ncbi:MAG: DUF2500 family protein [Armatimonadota bacterium]
MKIPIIIALIIYTLFMWGMIIVVFRRGYKEWRRNRDNRFYKMKASILDKREEKNTTNDIESWDKLVVFDFDGRQKEYVVTAEIFNMVRVGQHGTIHIQNQQVISFEPDVEVNKHDDLYGRMVKG